MMMKNYRAARTLRAITACLVTALLCACTSLQKDLHISSPREQLESDLSKLERMIVPLEAAGGTEARKQTEAISAARTLTADMEKNTAADKEYTAKLRAWSGRLAILEGKYSEARNISRESQTAQSGGAVSTILGMRLEGDPEKRLELAENEIALADSKSPLSGFGELHIEKARALFELRRFTESAGAFDAAFALPHLDSVYRGSYQSMRDSAWELRNTEGAMGSLEILERGGLTWKDCIDLAKNETRLLRFLDAGRNVSDAEMLNRLVDRAFIPRTQDIYAREWPNARPLPGDIVSRAGAAWFVWHLYAEARADRGLLSRYTTRYAAGTRPPRSPIADLPPLSPFFDSILGCVETEFMSLADGKNFMPGEPVRAAELLAVLKKIDN